MDEKKSESVWQNTLAQPNDRCIAPVVESTAQTLGVTCQQVFERAYIGAAQSATYGRAVFAWYLQSPEGQRILPSTVLSYCESHAAKAAVCGSAKWKRGFCSGCMLTKEGIAGLAYAYSLIYPSLDMVTAHATPEAKPLSDVETLWLKLVDSGATERVETWEDVIRAGDTELP